ncbi:MAG TPA: DedA family protein [Syntrophales bacterium]|jgi:membrane-associated protein|nr:DedA family protein [Syntrophales bacterium]HPX56477.1 DedA family protein [Syntrophales bacterium]HQA83106.1 DedA family protein [Syntrophales bacterium]
MDWFIFIVDLLLHLDRYLSPIIEYFGIWTYFLLFLIIFCETGLVVTPVLPGDSLLFGVGAFAAAGALNVELLVITLCLAAIAGDTVNYAIGHFVGPKVFHEERGRFFRKEYLDRTHRFYEKYGGKTIVLARFVPIVRTFAPFVAGIGSMTYVRFIVYNITGGIAWVLFFVLGGYYFGNLPVVKRNFSLVILSIIILSIMPGVIEYLRHRKERSA